MTTCYNCKHRIADIRNGDKCGKGGFPLMDGRFKYEHELLKLKISCPRYCPSIGSKDEK